MADQLASTSDNDNEDIDWPTQITRSIVGYIDQIRNKTTRPAIIASRGIVYGLLMIIFLPIAIVLLVVTLIRSTSFLFALWSDTHAVWASYALWGALLLIVGTILFGKRKGSVS